MIEKKFFIFLTNNHHILNINFIYLLKIKSYLKIIKN